LAQGLSFLVGSFDIEVTQVALSHSGLRRLRPCAKEGFTFLQSRRTRGWARQLPRRLVPLPHREVGHSGTVGHVIRLVTQAQASLRSPD